MPSEQVAIVHDYLTQRGGAERVVLSMHRAFPTAPIFTSMYDPPGTFQEFGQLSVATSFLDKIPALRHRHRAAMPLLPFAFSSLHVDAAVTLCSSSGWAHGVRTAGRKVVYCYAPARWLYQTDRYLGTESGAVTKAKATGLRILRGRLEQWDKRAARSADRYLVVSRAVAESVREIYGIEATVLAPPPALGAAGPLQPVAGIEPGFWLCVSRLLPYKNVDVVLEAARLRGGDRVVVVGRGPERSRLDQRAGPMVRFLEGISDAELRWCYANCKAVVTASYEDFGLTPLEAATLGRPTVALRAGGFLDTVVDSETGIFFDSPTPALVARALDDLDKASLSGERIAAHAEEFSEARFHRRLRQVVDEELALAR